MVLTRRGTRLRSLRFRVFLCQPTPLGEVCGSNFLPTPHAQGFSLAGTNTSKKKCMVCFLKRLQHGLHPSRLGRVLVVTVGTSQNMSHAEMDRPGFRFSCVVLFFCRERKERPFPLCRGQCCGDSSFVFGVYVFTVRKRFFED